MYVLHFYWLFETVGLDLLCSLNELFHDVLPKFICMFSDLSLFLRYIIVLN